MECTNLEDENENTGSPVPSIHSATILCCECGISIQPSPLNMCIACLNKNVDISKNIPKQAILNFCRNCERYLQPPNEWISADWESLELLALCLKKVKRLKEVKLVDASFVWTERHSKRIKLKLTVRDEISKGCVLRQAFVVEFTVQNQMCEDCHRIEAKDYWRCLVQVRQHAENKKTFYFLEQLILKHGAHENTLGMKPAPDGLDFYYANENHARKMIDFLQAMVLVKVTPSKRLTSYDKHNNHFYYKYTWSVEIAPISRDSIVCLSKKLRQQLGNISPICLVYKVSSGGIHLIDPLTSQLSELSGHTYFRAPFEAICNPKQLVEYIVMDIEIILDKDRKYCPGQGSISQHHVLCDIWVIRASQLGTNDNTIHTRSHLGHVLKVGDSVLGYNIAEANINDIELEKLSKEQIPDVVLVRKFYSDRQTRASKRFWKLKHLTEELVDERSSKYDYHEFLDDLEEDSDYRKQINVYLDKQKLPTHGDDTLSTLNVNMPSIGLAELIDDLQLL